MIYPAPHGFSNPASLDPAGLDQYLRPFPVLQPDTRWFPFVWNQPEPEHLDLIRRFRVQFKVQGTNHSAPSKGDRAEIEALAGVFRAVRACVFQRQRSALALFDFLELCETEPSRNSEVDHVCGSRRT